MSRHQDWPYDSCPECGSELYIITKCQEDGLVFDGEQAMCPECRQCVGTVVVEEDGSAWVNTFD